MKSITSLQNTKIKEILALHGAKERKQQGLFLAEGIRTISTLCKTLQPKSLFVTEKTVDQALKIVDEDAIFIVTEAIMLKITTAATAPGIIALFTIPQAIQPLKAGLVLADITDPGNMGTLIRTAVACNITTIITIEGTDPWGPKVIQSTAGTIASASIYQYTWAELMANKHNLQLYALVVKDGASLQTVNKTNSLLVVGNEAHGIRPEWLADCEYKITLQMASNIESLNAAIAGSIALYITHVGY